MNSVRYEISNSSASVNPERFGYEEIVFLLDLCDKNEIIAQSQTKGYNLVRAFTPIHKEMLESGYNRSLTQVIDKFRKLKLRFVHAYLARKKGKTAMANRYEHYRRFETMLDKAKVDIDTFIKKFSKKEDNNSDDNSVNFGSAKDDDSSRNILEYENIDEFDTVAMDDDDTMEKEVILDEDYHNDDTEDYVTDNVDLKLDDSSSFSNRNNEMKNLTPTDRTNMLLEQFIPRFKQAQMELQRQFFKQQRELLRQQQEWEERILDEEREYFTKLLSNFSNTSNQ